MSVDSEAAETDVQADEGLTLEAIEAAAGDVQEGRTIELLLEDDRVLVARVSQLQTGELTCPIDGCFRRSDSEKGKRTHVGKVHPDLQIKTCGSVR